ncbi:hypothetical protein Ciccas_013966 [Cichlidogyrus casuarinus]|uniref:EF-hand domain-containing protein n=1 Tax=Cichlidogyrus casuarinus TaxID=1844966 RepID=A0ABD2PJ81_9PLAT
MTSNSSQQQEHLLLRFQDMDTDKNGYLSKSEVTNCLKDLGYDKAFIKLFMKKFDKDRDGKITLNEYKQALGVVEETKEQSRNLRQVFHDIDKDHSGKISCRELVTLLTEMRFDCTIADLEAWLTQHGIQPDSEMDYDTFLNLMSST